MHPSAVWGYATTMTRNVRARDVRFTENASIVFIAVADAEEKGNDES